MTFSLTVSAIAQDGSRLEALKIAYITKKLNLSTEEAQRFWPVYNQYANEIRQVRQNSKDEKSGILDADEKILTIRKRYNGEFAKALPSEKVNQFFRCEREFGAFVQKELLERRQLRTQQRRPFKQ